jgi:hypothetical protein
MPFALPGEYPLDCRCCRNWHPLIRRQRQNNERRGELCVPKTLSGDDLGHRLFNLAKQRHNLLCTELNLSFGMTSSFPSHSLTTLGQKSQVRSVVLVRQLRANLRSNRARAQCPLTRVRPEELTCPGPELTLDLGLALRCARRRPRRSGDSAVPDPCCGSQAGT